MRIKVNEQIYIEVDGEIDAEKIKSIVDNALMTVGVTQALSPEMGETPIVRTRRGKYKIWNQKQTERLIRLYNIPTLTRSQIAEKLRKTERQVTDKVHNLRKRGILIPYKKKTSKQISDIIPPQATTPTGRIGKGKRILNLDMVSEAIQEMNQHGERPEVREIAKHLNLKQTTPVITRLFRHIYVLKKEGKIHKEGRGLFFTGGLPVIIRDKVKHPLEEEAPEQRKRYHKWSRTEEGVLIHDVQAGSRIRAIAKLLGRRKGPVFAKAWDLQKKGLIASHHKLVM